MTTVFIAKKYYKNCDKDEGKFFSGKNYKIFTENVDIYTENDELLCKFRKNVLKPEEINKLFQLKSAVKTGYTRPSASGFKSKNDRYQYTTSKSSGKQLHVLSNVSNKSTSGIVGFYDNISHFKQKNIDPSEKCRLTAFTSKHFKKYKDCLTIFQKISKIFKQLVPSFYKNQLNAIQKIDSEYIIPKTVFTTVTVNKNFRTALHKDVGDLKNGFGVMVVISDNDLYKGAYTLFPEYEIGIDCRNGDLLAFDVHQWHCNSKMIGKNSTRFSFIFYLREKMINACPI
jgi:hypothetical protein